MRPSPPIDPTIDGVALFYAPLQPQPVQRLSMVFRIGTADETLPTTGTLEVLALHAVDLDVSETVNLGLSIDHELTTFDIIAPPDELAPTLAALCTRLREPDPEALRRMAALLAEEARPAPTTLDDALLNRYGAQGPGLGAFRCAGLPRFEVDRALALGRLAFCRANAAVALDGTPPPDLRIDLPLGVRRPTIDPVPCVPGYPVGYPHTSQTDIIVTALAPHGQAAMAAQRLLARRITDALRHATGLVYAPSGVRVPFATHDVIGVRTDVPADAAAQAVETTFDAIMSLAAEGPRPDEVEADLRAALRQFDDPRSLRLIPWSQAQQHLVGEQPQGLAELKMALLAVTPDQVAAVVDGMIDTMMLGVPGQTPVSVADVHWDRGPAEPSPAQGRVFRVARGLVAKDEPEPRLKLGDDGTLWRGQARGVGVPLADPAAMYAWPDGARRLVRADGYQVVFEPQVWRGGRDLVALVDAAVPSERVIPQPARDADDIAHAPGAIERALFRLPQMRRFIWVILAVGVLVMISAGGNLLVGLFRLVLWFGVGMFVSGLFAKGATGQPGAPRGPRLEHPVSRSADDATSEEARR